MTDRPSPAPAFLRYPRGRLLATEEIERWRGAEPSLPGYLKR